MARYSDNETKEIYAAADRFREQCLERNGSLFSEGDFLWTSENLSKLYDSFVRAPDEGKRTFLEKFKDQIVPAGPLIVRLAAEALAVYLLFPSNVGAARKRELVGQVLGWVDASFPYDSIVARAFQEGGVGSGGQGYNARRPYELGFLIEFCLSWKRLESEDQNAAAADPWKFKAAVDKLEGAENRQIRHMLLNLLFPDHFERIASGNHKSRIVQAFRELVPDSGANDDQDELLFKIRDQLEKLLPNNELDFYWSPLSAAWYDESEGSTEFPDLDIIRHKKQVVLYGPPGTGKTFRAKRLARLIIRSAALKSLGAARYFAEQAQLGAKIETHVHRLQLHPAYSYEDFVRRLHISEKGRTEYRIGYLPQLVEDIEREDPATRLPHVLILDEINRTDLSRMLGECFSPLEDRNSPIDLPGRDANDKTIRLRLPEDLYVIGTMNLIDQSLEQVDFALRRRFFWINCSFDAESLLSAAERLWETGQVVRKWAEISPDFQRLSKAASTLNEEIRNSALLGPQYEVGHTYLLDVIPFLRNELATRPRRRSPYLWRNRKAEQPVHQVWRLSLKPLLEQYLSGLEASAREAELVHLEEAFLKEPPLDE